jgi:DNA-binding transcriptional MerR regulator
MSAGAPAYLRIGELARRSGVSPELLRAWERRYGLLQPSRSSGGFRLYTAEDETRVQRMNEFLASGLSAAEAARRALDEPDVAVGPLTLDSEATHLARALEVYDATLAHEIVDGALARYGTDTVLAEVVLPTLRDIGDRWLAGDLTIAQEHFASNVLRGRLMGLARGWGKGAGPIAVLACPPGELHDLPLIVFGIFLRSSGWRIVFLGSDTPVAEIERAVETVQPRLVVLNATLSAPLRSAATAVAGLATRTSLAVGGAAADQAAADRIGAQLLDADMRRATDQLLPALRSPS